MKSSKFWGYALAGLGAGCVSGLLGTGGGLVLIPLLTLLTDISQEALFPSSLVVMFPICVICLISIAFTGQLDWVSALPYMLGGGIGGYCGGKWGKKTPVKWLHRGLGLLIVWGGARMLWL